MSKNKLIILGILVFFSQNFALFGKEKELDNQRVNQIIEFVTYIEKYHEIKGYYPLGNGFYELPAVVYLNKDIQEVDYPIHYKNVTVYDYDKLIKELKVVFGDKIDFFNDPVMEYKKPSKYISKYYLGGNTFLVTVNLTSSVPCSYHNVFGPPQEDTYQNRSKIKNFKFYSGFMHRFSMQTISDINYNSISLNDYKKLKTLNFKNKKDPKKLYKAISKKNIEKVKVLIKNGIEINPIHKGFNEVNSPLIFAINNFEVVKLLVESGADPNARGSYEDPVLIYAMGNKKINYDLIKYLVTKGADVNLPNFFGISPFIGACKRGDIELIKIFIENGAKLNLNFYYHENGKFKLGYSPIESAIMADQLEVVKILVESGVKIDQRANNIKLSPLDFALKNNKTKAYELLKQLR